MKFAANISTMFKDLAMCERFNEASAFNFKAVEAQFLYDTDPLSLLLEGRSSAPVEFVLMNSPYKPGELFSKNDTDYDKDLAASMFYATAAKSMVNLVHRSDAESQIVDPFGMACLPENSNEFSNSIKGCMRLCDLMKCEKVHVLAGKIQHDLPFELQEETYLTNMRFAVGELQEYKVMTVIEPLCAETKPDYFLHSFEQAIQYIHEIDSDHFKLLLDVYHLYKIEGDVEAGLKKYLPYAGHIQISQSPGRIDPFENGDIDYKAVLDIIKESDYDGYIGLEYTPVGGENPDFSWMDNYID